MCVCGWPLKLVHHLQKQQYKLNVLPRIQALRQTQLQLEIVTEGNFAKPDLCSDQECNGRFVLAHLAVYTVRFPHLFDYRWTKSMMKCSVMPTASTISKLRYTLLVLLYFTTKHDHIRMWINRKNISSCSKFFLSHSLTLPVEPRCWSCHVNEELHFYFSFSPWWLIPVWMRRCFHWHQNSPVNNEVLQALTVVFHNLQQPAWEGWCTFWPHAPPHHNVLHHARKECSSSFVLASVALMELRVHYRTITSLASCLCILLRGYSPTGFVGSSLSLLGLLNHFKRYWSLFSPKAGTNLMA